MGRREDSPQDGPCASSRRQNHRIAACLAALCAWLLATTAAAARYAIAWARRCGAQRPASLPPICPLGHQQRWGRSMVKRAKVTAESDSPAEGTGFEPSVPPSSIGHSDVSHRFPNGSGGDWSHSRKPALGVPLARLTRIRISPIVFRLDASGRQVGSAKLARRSCCRRRTRKNRHRDDAAPLCPKRRRQARSGPLRLCAQPRGLHGAMPG